MAEKQMIITISREYGSGGHVIAEALSKKYGIPMYDHDLLKHIAAEDDLIDAALLEKYDEIPRNKFLYRSVKGFSNSPSENIANMQFDFLRKKADSGESFIAVGRCSEYILSKYPGIIKIFVLGDMEAKVSRIMKLHNLEHDTAYDTITRIDKQRKTYHNYYCPNKWGDSRYYDICINSTRLGIDATADFLADYIDKRINRQ